MMLILKIIMMLILKVIVDFNDDDSDVSDSECDSENEFDF